MNFALGILLMACSHVAFAMELSITARDSEITNNFKRIMSDPSGDLLFNSFVDKCSTGERLRMLVVAIEAQDKKRCNIIIRNLSFEDLSQIYDEIIIAHDKTPQRKNVKELRRLKNTLVRIILNGKIKDHIAEFYGYLSSDYSFFCALEQLDKDSEAYRPFIISILMQLSKNNFEFGLINKKAYLSLINLCKQLEVSKELTVDLLLSLKMRRDESGKISENLKEEIYPDFPYELYNATQMASAFTKLHRELFSNATIYDLLVDGKYFVEILENMKNWVSHELSNATKHSKKDRLLYFINVANELLNLNNFVGAVHLLQAIESSELPVEKTNSHEREIMIILKAVLSPLNNFGAYHSRLEVFFKGLDSGIVPLFIVDRRHIDNLLSGTDNACENTDNFEMLYGIILKMRKLQENCKMPPEIDVDIDLIKHIQAISYTHPPAEILVRLSDGKSTHSHARIKRSPRMALNLDTMTKK